MLLSEQLQMQKNELEYVSNRHERAFDDLRDYKLNPTLQVTQDLLKSEVDKWYIKKIRSESIVDRLQNLLNTFGDF